jgi:hypothetical protein
MLSISNSYEDLLKCLYFVDTIEIGDRGWKEAQRHGEDEVTLWVILLFWNVYFDTLWQAFEGASFKASITW